MTYFKIIKSLKDLKEQFKKLAKINHPDAGGDAEVMKAINTEYDQLFPIWKHKYNSSSAEPTEETAESTRRHFYTEFGWEGARYNSSLSTTDIAKILRTYVKEVYPTWKFSITSDYFSGGSSISIAVMEAPFNIFNHEANLDKENIHFQLYNMGDRDKNLLTEAAYTVMKDVYDQMQSYNFDDSDSMIDYFHCNFYHDFNIGKWNKGFKVVEKTARIKKQSKATAPATKNSKKTA